MHTLSWPHFIEFLMMAKAESSPWISAESNGDDAFLVMAGIFLTSPILSTLYFFTTVDCLNTEIKFSYFLGLFNISYLLKFY